jgi:hypothetical protein
MMQIAFALGIAHLGLHGYDAVILVMCVLDLGRSFWQSQVLHQSVQHCQSWIVASNLSQSGFPSESWISFKALSSCDRESGIIETYSSILRVSTVVYAPEGFCILRSLSRSFYLHLERRLLKRTSRRFD